MSVALQKLREIRDAFRSQTSIPAPNCWTKLDDESIWMTVVSEIMAVGGSRPVDERFKRDAELQERISYASLENLPIKPRLLAINRVLRDARIRYASSEPTKCRKSNAIAKNFEEVKRAGGPRAFLEAVSEIDEARQRIAFLIESFDYFGSKTARAFLMEHGLLQDALALDSRITTILSKIGIEIDRRYKTSETVYAREEQRLLAILCTPLGLKGIELDQILYQNYRSVLDVL